MESLRRRSDVDSRLPVLDTNSACSSLATSDPRPRSSHNEIALTAGSPIGTIRVLPPFPSTRTCSASKSTELTFRSVSSAARKPPAYASSNTARSRRSRGDDAGIRSSNPLTSSTRSTSGRRCDRRGAERSSAGFWLIAPCFLSIEKNDRNDASLRATVLGASPSAARTATCRRSARAPISVGAQPAPAAHSASDLRSDA